jgi:hypothetical protein
METQFEDLHASISQNAKDLRCDVEKMMQKLILVEMMLKQTKAEDTFVPCTNIGEPPKKRIKP